MGEFYTTYGTSNSDIHDAIFERITNLFSFPCTWTNDNGHTFRTETPHELMYSIEHEIGIQEEPYPVDNPVDEKDAAAYSAQMIVNTWLLDWDYEKINR